MGRSGRTAAAAVAIVAGLGMAGSAAASPEAGGPAPARVHPGGHPATAGVRTARPRPQVESAAVRSARDWAAEDPYSRFVCVSPAGGVATMGVVDRVDPSRPLTTAERAALCREDAPGSSH